MSVASWAWRDMALWAPPTMSRSWSPTTGRAVVSVRCCCGDSRTSRAPAASLNFTRPCSATTAGRNRWCSAFHRRPKSVSRQVISRLTSRSRALRKLSELPAAVSIRVISNIRRCRDDERAAILDIVNSAAEAYRGEIPSDGWHDPYMDSNELDEEIAAGVEIWGYEAGGILIGGIGIQPLRDVDLLPPAVV